MSKILQGGLLCFLFAGCSSAPHYEKMETIDQKFASSDDVTSGMALTRLGAVIDISVEEGQDQKVRLTKENAELKEKVSKLQNDLDEERKKVLVLRMTEHPPREPASEVSK